ncbi:MAG: beta-galactosidase [Anaerolineae bacterium]|nr:beta-galactosidase [Anaerolineae bacterium]
MNRRSLLLIGLLIALLIGLGAVLYPAVRPARSGDIHARREIPNTDLNPYGANFFLEREVEAWKREETVRMAAEAGIGWAKQQFVWAEIEPQQGQFRWAKYDTIVDLCERYGIQIIARLDAAPGWSRQDNTMPGRPPDDFELYGEFVYQFVSHYRGRVRYIQVWNEPNLFIEWGNRPVDPAGYVDLLKVAYERAKEADPNVYVLSAPLAITLGEPHPDPGKWRAMNDLQYLDEMYQAGAADYIDILSANAIGMDLPPEDEPSPSKLNFRRVQLQREIMERYGDGNKAVWLNEYGWNAAPESFAQEALIWQRVTEEQQADYTLRGIEYARENWPWAGVFNIWYFRQVGNISPQDAGYYFRMVDVDFTPRRQYLAVKDRSAQLRKAGPGYFEETHPAVQVSPGGWLVRIDAQASGGAVLASDVADSTLAFAFDGGVVSLIAWVGPGGGQLLATLDGQTVDGLLVDAQGRSYIDLYAPERAAIVLPVVRNADSKQRILRLSVAETSNPASTGRVCEIDAFQVDAPPERSFPVLSVVGFLVACVGVGWLLGRSMTASKP